jgi:hypothetical protein
LSLIQAKVVKSARNEPGYDSSNDADDNAINNLFDRSSMKKKQGRRYSFDDQQSEYKKNGSSNGKIREKPICFGFERGLVGAAHE